MSFMVVVKCIAHRKPLTVKALFFKTLDDVDAFFNRFGNVYHGRRCAQHSHDALIPVLTGVRRGGAASAAK